MRWPAVFPALARARAERRLFVTALAGAAVLLAATFPRELTAADAGARYEPLSPPDARERAHTGSVVTLIAPRSTMIKVAASTFEMGSTAIDVLEAVSDCARQPLGHRCREEMFSNELSRHRVKLSAFYLDRTEVTVREYERCVQVRRCRPVPYSEGARRFDKPNYPVSLVSWDDASDYCHFRGARLPTEAEFERAAAGVEGRRYPWGDLWHSRRANHGRLGVASHDSRDGYAELAPVGSFPSGRTPDGFLDLAGNVSEWTADRYAPGYPEAAADNPQGPPQGAGTSGRVVRGGDFSTAAPWLRSAARGGEEPTRRSPAIGFRCARSAGHVQTRR